MSQVGVEEASHDHSMAMHQGEGAVKSRAIADCRPY